MPHVIIEVSEKNPSSNRLKKWQIVMYHLKTFLVLGKVCTCYISLPHHSLKLIPAKKFLTEDVREILHPRKFSAHETFYP